MYKCSECGTKYKIMPKFCDCGNDIFIEEKDPETEVQDIEIPQEQPVRRKGRGKVETFSPIAVGSFVLCIILSLVILFFVGNPKKEITTDEQKTETKTEEIAEIPAIDSFWDNTVLKAEQKEEKEEEKPKEKPIIDMVPKFVQNILPQETKKTQAPITVKTVPAKTSNPVKQQPKTQTQVQKTQTKTTATSQKPAQTQQVNTQAQAVTNRIKNNMPQYNTQTPQKTVQPQPVQTVSPQPSQTTKTPPATQITQQTTPVQTVNNNPAPVTTTVSAPAPVVKTKSQTELTKELNTYKASLRNTIGRKIDFTKVIGDGDCALTFKINSSGRLVSKAFTKQSSNITLNDAVFSAMNSITSYNPPPDGYKGEALNLKIRFYNGNFEITLN